MAVGLFTIRFYALFYCLIKLTLIWKPNSPNRLLAPGAEIKRYSMSRKILHHLWQVGGEGLTAPGDAAIYLIRLGDRAALIDAGCGGAHAKLTANIDDCLGGQAILSHLLLTHCHFDHCGQECNPEVYRFLS
jgi:hypothetical protein